MKHLYDPTMCLNLAEMERRAVGEAINRALGLMQLLLILLYFSSTLIIAMGLILAVVIAGR